MWLGRNHEYMEGGEGGRGGGVVYQKHIMSKSEIYHENIGGYYDSYGGYHDSYRGYHEHIGDWELYGSSGSSLTKYIYFIY